MSDSHSTRWRRPRKPYPTFPLYPHPTGKWAKKIRGSIYYFGNWARRQGGKLVRTAGDGWQEALAIYKSQADDLHAGREPSRQSADCLTLKALGDQFLTAKLRKLEAGELDPATFAEYVKFAQLVADHFGKNRQVEGLTPADFGTLRARMARKWGPTRLSKAITIVRCLFKFAFENGLIPSPVRYGDQFAKPSQSVLRKHRAARGERMLEAAEIRKLLDGADARMKALVLLGINAGLGNTDVSDLQLRHVDFDGGWLDYPRPKTGVGRRAKLWPETVAAIRAAVAGRPAPQREEDAGCVFLSERGQRLVSIRGERAVKTDAVSREFSALLEGLGTHRPGVGFYTLRHAFRTVADAARDPVACDSIMGHADHTMAGHYRERVDDSRLEAVAEYVRGWLFEEGALS
jgi:integrase